MVDNYGGWFDKFMGDGLMAYWPCPDGGEQDALQNALLATRGITAYFVKALPRLLAGCADVSAEDTGLYFGVDYGPAHLVIVARDLTIIGMPAIGATRMAHAAEPGEVLCTRDAGELITSRADEWRERSVAADPTVCSTKEGERDALRICFL